jgi:NMD protein affecting ribosome stability and mRNA decay
MEMKNTYVCKKCGKTIRTDRVGKLESFDKLCPVCFDKDFVYLINDPDNDSDYENEEVSTDALVK